MRKNVYEIFDEFVKAPSKDAKLGILKQNWSPTLELVLQLAYHPNIKWKIKGKYPEGYKREEQPPGMSYSSLSTELRRLYIFQEGNPTAERLTPKKQEELLVVLLESLEPREADVVIGIFKKDLGVKGLTYRFIRDNIPNMLP